MIVHSVRYILYLSMVTIVVILHAWGRLVRSGPIRSGPDWLLVPFRPHLVRAATSHRHPWIYGGWFPGGGG